jgi:hypothetical protein
MASCCNLHRERSCSWTLLCLLWGRGEG